MTKVTIEGMLYLYESLDKSRQNPYFTEVYERALNEFVRNPDRTGDIHNLVRSSAGSAKKVINTRKKHEFEISDEEKYNFYFDSKDISLEEEAKNLENIDYISKVIKNRGYAEVITMLYDGLTAADIAIIKGISQKHANTLISRARAYAKKNIKNLVV